MNPMSEPTPRDVIAKVVASWWSGPSPSYVHNADAILDALDQAGFQVTPKPVEFDGIDDLINQARG
jgi:hypothetical protein